MADISKELNDIMTARYGKDVRQSIHDGIEKINNEVEIDSDNFGSSKDLALSTRAYIKRIVDISELPFEKGTYGTTDGKKYDNDNYIRTVQMFTIPERYSFKNSVALYILYYDQDLAYKGYERFTDYGDITLTPPEGSSFMNLILGDVGGQSNLEDRHRITFLAFGSEYLRGNRKTTIESDDGEVHSYELYISDEGRIIAKAPFNAEGSLELYRNGRLIKTEPVYWYTETIVENSEFYDFAILKSSFSNSDLTNSFVMGCEHDQSAILFDENQSVSYGTGGEETTADQQYVKNPTDIYFLIRFPSLRLYTFSTDRTPLTPDYRWCSGILRLPKGYSHLGRKSPIAFFTHGTSGWVGNGAVQSQFNRCNYLLKNGIACFDVNGWTGCYGEELPPNNRYNGQNMGNPAGCACAHKAFEYIKLMYNVEDKCLVVGNSMGGLLALNYANNYRNDILGCFLLYPVIDLKGQAWDNPWNDRCKSNITTFYLMEEDDVYEEKCTYGFNPYKNNYAGIPIFIWHGEQDALVSPETSKQFAQLQNQNGGSVYLRMVDELGHGDYGNWQNIFETESLYAINRFITTMNSLS